MPRQPSYRDLLQRLAEHPDARTFRKPDDLPEVTLPELATVLDHYPNLFADAIADADLLAEDVTKALTRDRSELRRYQTVGFFVVSALHDYVLRLLLKDVQLEVERLRESAAIERQSESRRYVTPEQAADINYGVGRLFS